MVKMVKMVKMVASYRGQAQHSAGEWRQPRGPKALKTIYKYDITATHHLYDITGPTNRPVITFEKLFT